MTDEVKSKEYYEKAAAQGSAYAMVSWAFFKKTELRTGFELFSKAAEQNILMACIAQAFIYMKAR